MSRISCGNLGDWRTRAGGSTQFLSACMLADMIQLERLTEMSHFNAYYSSFACCCSTVARLNEMTVPQTNALKHTLISSRAGSIAKGSTWPCCREALSYRAMVLMIRVYTYRAESARARRRQLPVRSPDNDHLARL